MASNLVANVTVTGNLMAIGTMTALNVQTINVASGFTINNLIISNVTTVAAQTAMASRGAAAFGNFHSAYVLANGTIVSSGVASPWGQTGQNDQINRSTPVQVWGISSGAMAVACGYQHTAALLSGGTVVSWGQNTAGCLGVNDITARSTPCPVVGGTSVTAIACGSYFTSMVLTNGVVKTAGQNNYGQLGDGTMNNQLQAVSMIGITSATMTACGQRSHVVLLSDGTLRGVGDGLALGINDTSSRLTPVQVWGISSSAIAIASGLNHAVALLANGTVMAWGTNSFGQLGVNDTTSRLTPVQVLNITSAIAVGCGGGYTVFVLSNGTVWTCGLGVVSEEQNSRLTPVQIWGISSSAVVVSSGLYGGTAIIINNGTLLGVGANSSGQLGLNDTTFRQTPVPVFSSTVATAVCAPCLSIGRTNPQYQLDLSQEYVRKLYTSTWMVGSDRRVKADIESANLARCVEIVDSLDLKYFKWNYDASDSHSLGWIAQDVKQFFPKSIHLSVDYGLEDCHILDSDQLIKTMYGALKKMVQDTYPLQEEPGASDPVPEPSQDPAASL